MKSVQLQDTSGKRKVSGSRAHTSISAANRHKRAWRECSRLYTFESIDSSVPDCDR